MSADRMVRINFKGQPRDCIAGQLILKVRRDVYRDAEQISRMIAEAVGSRNSFTVVVPFDERGVGLIELSRDADLGSIAATLERNPAVVYAEPNDKTELFDNPAVMPADPRFADQWALQAIQAPAAWATSQGSDNLVIAVLDTGLPMAGNPPILTHEDLSNPARFFIGSNFASPGSPPADDHGHGTHVTGIAAAESNNGRGIAGVNWRCRVLACKVFFPPVGQASPQGSAFMVYQGTQEAISFARARGWRLIINHSGGGLFYSAIYEDCARAALNAGAIFCAAAGNEYGAPVRHPAALSTRADGSVWYENVIAVSATTRGDDLAAFSNRGIQINVAAPGADILSTVPNYAVPLGHPSGYDCTDRRGLRPESGQPPRHEYHGAAMSIARFRLRGALVAAIFLTACGAGDRQPANRGALTPDMIAPGAKLEVQSNGQWWPATIVQAMGDRALVHYDGYGDDRNEVVTSDRLRPLPAANVAKDYNRARRCSSRCRTASHSPTWSRRPPRRSGACTTTGSGRKRRRTSAPSV